MRGFLVALAVGVLASCNQAESSALTATAPAAATVDPMAGTFAGAKGAAIAYAIYRKEAAKGAVVILPGYAESYLSYGDLIQDVMAHGYSVYIMDHRGMGKSSRLAKNPQIVHIDSVTRYVDDAETFVDQIVTPDKGDSPLYLFAHSTGGLIGAKLLARRPEMFRRAVLSSPLFTVNTDWWPELIAYSTVVSAWAVGLGSQYAPGFHDGTIAGVMTFEGNKSTHSPERFERMKQDLLAHPETFQNGPSNNWIKQVIEATADAGTFAKAVTTPVLLTQAGQDTYVLPAGQNLFCKNAVHCTLAHFAAAKHSIFRETDDLRVPMLNQVFQHFAAGAPQ